MYELLATDMAGSVVPAGRMENKRHQERPWKCSTLFLSQFEYLFAGLSAFCSLIPFSNGRFYSSPGEHVEPQLLEPCIQMLRKVLSLGVLSELVWLTMKETNLLVFTKDMM